MMNSMVDLHSEHLFAEPTPAIVPALDPQQERARAMAGTPDERAQYVLDVPIAFDEYRSVYSDERHHRFQPQNRHVFRSQTHHSFRWLPPRMNIGPSRSNPGQYLIYRVKTDCCRRSPAFC